MRGLLTLCGSTKFEHLFRVANAELTMADWAVLTVGVFDRTRFHNPEDPESVALKARLDALHFAKIDMSQAVVVLNGDATPLGLGPAYIGDSTRREVAHARAGHKEVYWWDLTGALHRLVEGESGVPRREPWDWGPGDRGWADLLGEPQRRAYEEAAAVAGRAREFKAEAEAEGELDR